MAQSEPLFRLGEVWIGRRGKSDNLYRYWWDAETKRTRRASLGTSDLEEAKLVLKEWYAKHHLPEDEKPEDVPLATVIRVYYEEHAMHIASHEAARIALNLWLDFFADASVDEATKPKSIDKFIKWLDNGKRSANYINRVLSSGRAGGKPRLETGHDHPLALIREVKVGHVPPRDARSP